MTLLSFILVIGLFSETEEQTKIAVIANKSTPVQAITVKEIRDIYTLKTQRWPNGEIIVLFNLKSKSALKEKFYEVLGQTATQLQRIWIRFELTGEAKAPTACKDEDELLQKVAATPNAIGYISANKVTDAVTVLAKID